MTSYEASMTAKRRVVARVNEVEELARRLYPQYAIFGRPTIGFIQKGKRAGACSYKENRYTFNLGQALQNDSIERLTVPHEVAHMVAGRVYGERGHGPRWVTICLALGGDGKRCYDAEERGITVQRARRKNEYLYLDSKGGERWIGPVHHSRLQKRGGDATETRAYRLVTGCGARIHKTGFLNKKRTVG